VLTAGVLNTARNSRLVYETAQRASFSQLRSSSIRIITPTWPSTSAGSVQLFAPVPTGPGALSWSNVPADLWWRSAWSIFLAAGGAAGLIALLRHQRRPLTPGAWRAVRIHAMTLFSVYAGYHLYLFAEEVSGW
jgi:hypothetical protein